MSEFSCPVVLIHNLKPVPNSDSLEMTEVFETPVVVRKGQFKVGDKAVYIPAEAMVPMSKHQFQGLGIKTEKDLYRVKAVRLRGTYSEGLLVPIGDTVEVWDGPNNPVTDTYPESVSVGKEMSHVWGITKYEEQEPTDKVRSEQEKDLSEVPRYHVNQLVRSRDAITQGVNVTVTEKIHGCNARFMYGEDPHGTVRLNVGSHNTWRRPKYKTGFIPLKRFINRLFGKAVFDIAPLSTDDWWSIANRYDMSARLSKFPDHVFYGEIYGKVQDLNYGLPNSIDFVLFDVYNVKERLWLSPGQVSKAAEACGLRTVPVLYTGPYIKERVDILCNGMSALNPHTPTIREGIVIKPTHNDGRHIALKLVSEKYKLRKNGTEFH